MPTRCTGKSARAKIRRIFERDGNQCHYCNRAVHLDMTRRTHSKAATLDHVRTIAEGGGNEMWNLVVACKRCNEQRGTMPYDQFRGIMKVRSNKLRVRGRFGITDGHAIGSLTGRRAAFWDLVLKKLKAKSNQRYMDQTQVA